MRILSETSGRGQATRIHSIIRVRTCKLRHAFPNRLPCLNDAQRLHSSLHHLSGSPRPEPLPPPHAQITINLRRGVACRARLSHSDDEPPFVPPCLNASIRARFIRQCVNDYAENGPRRPFPRTGRARDAMLQASCLRCAADAARTKKSAPSLVFHYCIPF